MLNYHILLQFIMGFNNFFLIELEGKFHISQSCIASILRNLVGHFGSFTRLGKTVLTRVSFLSQFLVA